MTLNCPPWCSETHGLHDLAAGSIDHAASFLHDRGGALVALHRLDVDGVPGNVRVMIDPVATPSGWRGPDARPTRRQRREDRPSHTFGCARV